MNANDGQIRPAVPDETESLTDVAVASKAHWGYDAAFMARFADVIALDRAYIGQQDVWVLVQDGEIAGFYALIRRGEVAELHHLWLLPAYIGRGLGRLLFEHAVNRASGSGARRPAP